MGHLNRQTRVTCKLSVFEKIVSGKCVILSEVGSNGYTIFSLVDNIEVILRSI